MGTPILLEVPKVRQPDPVACLPTAVWIVLRYQGTAVSYEEIAEACRMDENGCVQELALQGLREAGYDVEFLSGWDSDVVRAALDDERPVVVSLPMDEEFAHAMVVCGRTEDGFIVLDPQTGDYRSLRTETLAALVGEGLTGAFLVSGYPVGPDSEPP